MVGRITYQAYATECKVRDEGSRPLNMVLWKIASGTADYGEVLRDMCSYGVLRSLLVGAAVTLRNVAFEVIFRSEMGGVRKISDGGAEGEARSTEVASRRRAWGRNSAPSPDFERMYVIKIRGSEQEIMDELAKFGHPMRGSSTCDSWRFGGSRGCPTRSDR